MRSLWGGWKGQRHVTSMYVIFGVQRKGWSVLLIGCQESLHIGSDTLEL